jgi:predicted DNA-binding transcriptional regulator AlpA
MLVRLPLPNVTSGHIPDDMILTDLELSRLGFGHRVTLTRKRKSGDGPPFIKLSPHRVGYRMGDVRAWLASRTIQPAGK